MRAVSAPPRSGSVGVRARSAASHKGQPMYDYGEETRVAKPISLLSQFSKSSNHHRGDIPDRFFMKIDGQDEMLYAHAFSQHVNNKARLASKKQRDTDFLVYDSERTEDRIAMGRPPFIGKYRNGEYHAV